MAEWDVQRSLKMFKSVKDIDIDALRKNHVRFYYFGLGFIQLKLDEKWRLHFYNSKLPGITEDVHNHRYDFTSRILLGEITNYRYDVFKGDTHVINNESCNADIKAPRLEEPCHIEVETAYRYRPGSFYNMKDTSFHRVKADYCITLLERTPRMKEFAQVITPKGQAPVCPFSKKVPEEEMWAIIEEMLKAGKS